MNVIKEWFIQAPWGKIALMSFGNPSGPVILVAHGRQDSLASFIPLLALLPRTYHYIALDFPGHGLSDAFPIGPALCRFHMVPALVEIVKQLQLEQFIYLAHSMGTEVGKFYNAIFPGRVSRFIDLDPGPAMYAMQLKSLPNWYTYFYERYYDNYHKYSPGEARTYSQEEALAAVMRSRHLTEEQAELVLSRNLVPLGGDRYRLSWDQRLKYIATLNIPESQYLSLVTESPPTLAISANQGLPDYLPGVARTKQLLDKMQSTIKNYFLIHVEGGHDVHLTNPERVAPSIITFLQREFDVKSKL